MEFFEALYTFTIDTIRGFKEVAGTKLSDGFAAYQSDVKSFGWSVIDIASGRTVTSKLPTLTACKKFIKNMPEDMREKIAEIRQKPEYKEHCAKIAAWKPVEVESLDFDAVFEQLNDLYTEDEPINLL